MTDVTVDLKDLKKLVQALMDSEVRSRCHIAATNRILGDKPLLRTQHADEFTAEKPKAGNMVFLRYREAMNALESGEDIRSAISRLAGRI